jgi:membrane protease YdiL (CAAX protease family)
MKMECTQKSNGLLFLLIALLLLRFPLLYLGEGDVIPKEISFIVYLCGTYLVTGLLVYQNRQNLEQYNITPVALLVFLIAPLAAIVAGNDYDPTLWLRVLLAALFVVLLFAKGKYKPSFVNVNVKKTLADAAFALLLCFVIPIAVHAIRGFPIIDDPNAIRMYSGIPNNLFYQLSSAAISEEPLFRGFLWGYLKGKGITNGRICLIQAGLFWIGHIYYIGTGVNFWIVHPLLALLLGLIVWKSKSITHSMVVHSCLNTFSDYLRLIRLF